jgi:hypothetical protein
LFRESELSKTLGEAELYKIPDLVADIKTRRLEKLGCAIRMDEERVDERISESEPGSRKSY